MGRPRGTNLDLTGQTFGRLFVISRAADRDSDAKPRVRWVCRCACGGRTETRSDGLLTGIATSCGCYRLERAAEKNTRHGQSGDHGDNTGRSRSSEYRAWCNMKTRCKPEFKGRSRYFDRGISVCTEWYESFEVFLGHVGRRPSDQHSLDRIDNDGNYEPGNVRWATRDVQMTNRECNKPLLERIARLETENAELRRVISAGNLA